MSEFDSKAASWDENPDRIKRAKEIAVRMLDVLDFDKYDNALEYGSGTGLLSFELKDILKKITLMDQSAEMIKIAELKCNSHNITNIESMHYDLLEQTLPKQRYDLIYTLLTLHHIPDTESILNKFSDILTPHGTLVLIDLVKEDGSFHDGNFHGHKGFDKVILERQLRLSGLLTDHYEICYELEKEKDGRIKHYPLFMLIAYKA